MREEGGQILERGGHSWNARMGACEYTLSAESGDVPPSWRVVGWLNEGHFLNITSWSMKSSYLLSLQK